jgi:hypothetical protein
MRLLGQHSTRVALFVGLFAVTAVIGLSHPSGAQAFTRGFQIYNLSGYSLRLQSTEGAYFSKPDDGEVIDPGVYRDFEVIFYEFSENDAVAHFDVLDDNGGVVGHVDVDMTVYAGNNFGGVSSACSVHSDGPNLGPCQAGDQQQAIKFLDPPGTVHDIPARQGEAQATVLKQLCGDDSQASCTFAPTGETHVDSPQHQVGDALINNTDEEQETTINASDTVGSSDSVSVSLSAETTLFETVTVAIETSYNHTWTDSKTFSQSVDVHCPAHNRCVILATQPMLRDAGDFTVTLDNTTWHLRDVYFDTPDPTGNGGAYEVDSTALSPSEEASLPPTFAPENDAQDNYSVPQVAVNDPTTDPRLQLSAPPQSRCPDQGGGIVGQPVHACIMLTSTQEPGRLVYALGTIDIDARVAGLVVQRWTISNLTVDQSRVLDFTSQVPAAGCVTLEASAEHAIGASSQECGPTSAAGVSNTRLARPRG